METERQVPCNYCRDKHLKCNLDETPCTHCSKLGQECIRARKRIRFSKNKRLDASLGFSEHQTWVQTKNANRLAFVDATPHIARRETSVAQIDEPAAAPTESDTADSNDVSGLYDNNEVNTDQSDLSNDVIVDDDVPVQSTSRQPPSYESLVGQGSRLIHRNENAHLESITTPVLSAPSFSSFSPSAQSDSAANLRRVASLEWRSDGHTFMSPNSLTPNTLPIRNFATSPLDTALQNRVPSTALRGLPNGFTEDAYLQLREACLMRHFVEVLAPWVSCAL